MPARYEFNISTRIVYGRNAAAQMGEIAGGFNLKKIQLITDKGVANSGTLEFLLRPLKDAGIAAIIYDDVEYNPTVQTVDKAAQQFRDEACEGVISVGGGSPIDAGKCVGVLATNAGSASDYLGIDKVKNPAVPVICVPTTAGTAAEITDVAVLNDPTKKQKMGMRSPHVAAAVAMLDPVLTLTLPPEPTRDSGLDALTHAIESYISVNAWRVTDTLNLKAIELIGRYLRTAVHNGNDIEARDGMLTASLLAGMGFHHTKLCLVHAITLPFGGIYNVPHGVSNAIVLPHAMKFMLPGAVSKYVDIAMTLGEDVSGMSERAAAEKAVEAVEQLSNDVNLPTGLAPYGVKEEDLPKLSESIADNFMVPLSPRIAKAEDILEICKAAM
ncbi:MAG: iron-containing alcohol dehydrogenase [Desulfobacterales bacterium]|nr:MAG: iron-containing alcohol dehydrogenase [Desulfobacterales bacterium]